MTVASNSSPAQSLWDLVDQLEYGALEPSDARRVDTAEARGNFSRKPLLRGLGVDESTLELRRAPGVAYTVLSGHRGCGKSTELRRLTSDLDSDAAYATVFVDAAESLDPNNLQYPDVFLALAEALVKKLQAVQVTVDDIHVGALRDWFTERVEKHESTRDFAAEVKTGAAAEAGLPFLGKLFASITTAFKVNSTYKTELRRVVQNSFAHFASAFNNFVIASEEALGRAQRAKRVLFVIDGLDRLNKVDATRFFIEDVHQLLLAKGIFLYVAPINLLYSNAHLQATFKCYKLPMIKLAEKGSSQRIEPAYRALRELVYKRAAPELFDKEATLDRLITSSGGHPRDLLRLLNYAYEHAVSDVIDEQAAAQAIRSLASDYRRLLQQTDYELLRRIDSSPKESAPSDERVQSLLFNLVVLEYNDYWWQTHPVVRTLTGYANAPAPPAPPALPAPPAQ